MASFRRALIPGATYFLTAVTRDRVPRLCDPAAINALRQACLEVQRIRPFKILAMVVLPDHMHSIWELPTGDSDFSSRMSLIKRKVGAACPALRPAGLDAVSRRRRESGFWQRRFWEHLIRDEHDLARHVDYIHFNPVHHGLAVRAMAWPHSSIHRWVARGDLAADWGGTADATAMECGEP